MTRRTEQRVGLLGWAVLTVGYAGVVLALLSAESLAAGLGLGTRQYDRVLAYPAGVLTFVWALISYRYFLWPTLVALWPGGPWPVASGWYRRPWFYVLVAALVVWWPPMWQPGKTWRELVDSVLRLWVVVGGVTLAYIAWVRRSPGRVGGRWAVNLALSCLVVVWAAGAVESYFRLDLHTDGLGRDSLGTINWFRVYVKWNHVPAGGKVHKFRDREFANTKPPGTLRIAMIGDSIVFAQGVRRVEDRVGNRLERLLTTPDHPVEVYNIAQCGNHLVSAIEWLTTVAVPYRCDVVVLMHSLNDIECVADQPSVIVPEPGPVWRWALGQSFALSHLYHRVALARGFRTDYVGWLVDRYADPTIWAEYRKRLRAFFVLCYKHRVPAMFVQVPILPAVDDYPVGLIRVHRKLIGVVRDVDVPALDLLNLFAGMDPRDLVVSAADRHPNERANHLMAGYLARKLRPLLPEVRAVATRRSRE